MLKALIEQSIRLHGKICKNHGMISGHCTASPVRHFWRAWKAQALLWKSRSSDQLLLNAHAHARTHARTLTRSRTERDRVLGSAQPAVMKTDSVKAGMKSCVTLSAAFADIQRENALQRLDPLCSLSHMRTSLGRARAGKQEPPTAFMPALHTHWKHTHAQKETHTHTHTLTSWYIDGLDSEGMVKDSSLLFPSLSTISCNMKQMHFIREKCNWPSTLHL